MGARITNAIFFLLFVYFAIVQYNDPDPLLWMILYAFVGIVALLGVFQWYNRWLLLGGMALFTGFFVWLLPSAITWITSPDMGAPFEMVPTEPAWMEETRECLGALIGLATLLTIWRFSVAFARKSGSAAQ